jgi:guanylate kinase
MSNSDDARREGLLLLVSSPSGAGKTSLAKRLTAAHPDLALSVSATTRPARTGELDGREYHFIAPAEFEAMAVRGDFLESAEVHEHRYGTPRAPVMEAIAAGRDVLFDIDWQGAGAIHAALPDQTVRIFVLPPSMAVLAERLRGRAQDAADVIDRRLARARGEIAKWTQYDYVIVNDDLDRAFGDLDGIYRAERLRRLRNPWLTSFVEGLLSGGD